MAEVQIDRDRDGWHYFSKDGTLKSVALKTYQEITRRAQADGHTVNNGGWIHRLLSWNWHGHSFDRYPGWEIEKDESPAFVKLSHKRGGYNSEVESAELCKAWDDLAQGDFYQRDWTSDGIPMVRDGETYWSGWWFETISERDRFVKWIRENHTSAQIVF